MTFLIDGFSGAQFAPGSAEFAASAVSHGVTLSPALIVRPLTEADVAVAVLFAQTHELPITVRSGGHSAFDMDAAGLIIELGELRAIEVLGDSLVRVEPGAVWGDVATALEPHGLAITSGDTYSVGVGGLTLGGGIGWLVRGSGLTLDNLVEARVVLPSGSIVTASAESEPELLWALRGGGGNFGIVTSFVLRAESVSTVISATISCDPSSFGTTLKAWRDVMRSLPESVNVTAMASPPMTPGAPAVAQLLVVSTGTEEELAPLLTLPGVVGSDIQRKRYVELLNYPPEPPGPVTFVTGSGLVSDLSDELIDELLAVFKGFGPGMLSVRYLGGALNRVPSEATAFAFRSTEAVVFAAAVLPPDAPLADQERIRTSFATLAPHLNGLNANFVAETSDEIVERLYPPATLERLRAVKRSFDPRNVFASNHNVKP